MKKPISIVLFSILALAITSCSKSVQTVDPSLHNPEINALIYRNVNQPTNAVLGESTATFAIGDKIIVYVPYQIANDEINTADLIIRDDQGELVTTKQLTISIDPVAEGLNVPDELQGTQFLYGTIEVEDFYANKNLNLSIEIRGANSGYGTDKIDKAFTVQP